MFNLIECTGHPRDLGLAQGLALRTAIAKHVDTTHLPSRRRRRPSLAAFTSGSIRGGGAGREVIRHFTHLAERVDGLARGAGIPFDSLMKLQLKPLTGAPDAIALSAIALDEIPGATVVRSLSGRDWVIRRSLPEVGFASLEVAHPWHVGAIAGLNEEGLAACIVPGSESFQNDGLPPSQLLVQECLQRFTDVAAGLGWCTHRPVGGGGTILLADASGDRASIRFESQGRTIVERSEEALCAGGPPQALEAIREGRQLDLKAIARRVEDEHGLSILRLSCSRLVLEAQGISGDEARFSLPVNGREQAADS